MKTVRILGMAPNMANMPPVPPGVEAWPSNYHKGYLVRNSRIIHEGEWTRWFNLHSRRHMTSKYPAGYKWYTTHEKPIILQEVQSDIPASQQFPREALQQFYSLDGTPFRYFTCSVCWLIALAIFEGFERIELWGFEVKATKPKYAFERPCIAYWVNEARKRGIEVWLPPELKPFTPDESGDPLTYTGPLYGYETT
jgi:hypothetical protein